MAEGTTFEEAANQKKPGIGMRMTISLIKKKFPSVNNISTEDLHKKFTDANKTQENENNANISMEKLIILDCRPDEEYNVSRIPGSLRVEHEWGADKILGNIAQATDKADIVCYCSVGYRSSVVAEKIQEYYGKKSGSTERKPAPNVYNLEGSLFKWANEGRIMVDSQNQPTCYAHPYNAVFGKLLDSKLRKS